jgi:hypothetical protein
MTLAGRVLLRNHLMSSHSEGVLNIHISLEMLARNYALKWRTPETAVDLETAIVDYYMASYGETNIPWENAISVIRQMKQWEIDRCVFFVSNVPWD